MGKGGVSGPRGPRLNSKAGKARLDSLVSESRFDWVNWPSRFKNFGATGVKKTRILLICSVCKFECVPQILEFMQKKNKLACKGCQTSSMRFSSSISAYDSLTTALKSKNLEFEDVLDYKAYCALNPRTVTCIKTRCLACGIRGNPRIGDLLNSGQSQACFCNGGVKYASGAFYDYLVERLDGTGCRLLVSVDEYLASSPATGSRIPCICTKCKVAGDLNIAWFLNKGALHSCGCRNRTELKVHDHICTFANSSLESAIVVNKHFRDPGLVGVGGKPLEFDISINCKSTSKLLLIVEVDGPHHFNSSYLYRGAKSQSSNGNVIQHDIKKEAYCVKNNVSMLRIESYTVMSDSADWKSWIEFHVKLAAKCELDLGIYRLSKGDEYTNSAYSLARTM